MIDILKTIEPKSDQQNFDDYLGGPKTVTVAEVKVLNGGEQPVEVHLVEFPGRPFKPGKSMRRVLISAWGKQSSEWAGRRITLYGDPTVKFGGQEVGGIRISHLSDIPSPIEVHLTVTRGKRAPFTVLPLREPFQNAHAAIGYLNVCLDLTQLQHAWKIITADGLAKDPAVIAAKDARKAELSKPIEGEIVPDEIDPADPRYQATEDER